MRVGLKAVLVSPHFLFLREKTVRTATPAKLRRPRCSTISPWPAGCRTSCGARCPTRNCSQLAEQGKLREPDDAAPAGRADAAAIPRRAAFTENFAGQWLGLRAIDATMPDRMLYPEYDDILKVSMVKETLLFFDEVLEERPEPDELRGLRLHDAQRAAGEALRHSGRRRAGVPQGGAAAGEPSRRRADDGQRAEGDGQRHDDLADPARRVGARPHPRHAAAEADRRCRSGRARHSRRDDDSRATGQASAGRRVRELPRRRSIRRASPWRTSTSSAAGASTIASVGDGEPVVVDGRRVRYLQRPAGRCRRRAARRPAVSATSTNTSSCCWPTRISWPAALAEKLLAYATGRRPHVGRSAAEIEAIVAPRSASKDYGFRSLVHEVVQSREFVSCEQMSVDFRS